MSKTAIFQILAEIYKRLIKAKFDRYLEHDILYIMKKKKITTIEDLAVLMQNEFLSMRGEMNERFDRLEKEVKELRRDIDDLKLRVGELASRFEFNELERRLRKVEVKLGLVR